MERLEPGRDQVIFHTASGALTVRRAHGNYVMNFPARPSDPVAAPAGLAEALGTVPAEVYVNAFNYLAVLDNPQILRALSPDMAAIARMDRPGVIVTAPGEDPYDFISRYFAPAKGVPEDPVTGAAHCMLAPYWAKRLGKTALTAFQASRRGGKVICRMPEIAWSWKAGAFFFLEGEVELLGQQSDPLNCATAGQSAAQIVQFAEMPVQVSVKMDQELLRRERDFEDLFRILALKLFGRKCANDAAGIASRNATRRAFNCLFRQTSCAELDRASSLIGQPADLPANVLAKISFQMQHQIPGGIRDAGELPPKCFVVGKRVDLLNQPGQVAPKSSAKFFARLMDNFFFFFASTVYPRVVSEKTVTGCYRAATVRESVPYFSPRNTRTNQSPDKSRTAARSTCSAPDRDGAKQLIRLNHAAHFSPISPDTASRTE